MKRKNYVAPNVKCTYIYLEHGLCAGSALVKPQTPGDVSTEWETLPDQNHNYEWDWQ